MVENTLISSGLLKSYNAVNISKVRYLAVVIDSEEARETSKVLELLCWLASVGLKSICLYDREGKVVKKLITSLFVCFLMHLQDFAKNMIPTVIAYCRSAEKVPDSYY